jgi:hypothetical protein
MTGASSMRLGTSRLWLSYVESCIQAAHWSGYWPILDRESRQHACRECCRAGHQSVELKCIVDRLIMLLLPFTQMVRRTLPDARELLAAIDASTHRNQFLTSLFKQHGNTLDKWLSKVPLSLKRHALRSREANRTFRGRMFLPGNENGAQIDLSPAEYVQAFSLLAQLTKLDLGNAKLAPKHVSSLQLCSTLTALVDARLPLLCSRFADSPLACCC